MEFYATQKIHEMVFINQSIHNPFIQKLISFSIDTASPSFDKGTFN